MLDLVSEHINKPHTKNQTGLLSTAEKVQLLAAFGLGYIQEGAQKIRTRLFGKKDKHKEEAS